MSRLESDLILRVIETLSQRIGDVAPGAHKNFYAEYNEAFSILRRADGWVSVSDQLPTESGSYVVAHGALEVPPHYYYMGLAHFNDGAWYHAAQTDVVYYLPQPLPELPQ